ncbi:MAG: rhomboid family intramembrane serine protease, partial [Candidatus Sulfotelmatobacter sp.]
MLPIKDDQPRYSTPFVTWFLIGLNLVIFFFEWALDPRSLNLVIHQFGVVPYHTAVFLGGSPRYSLAAVVLPFFTSMFLHGSWMHVIGNMWFLYIFGDNVEDYLGHFKYLVFYILTGL